MTRALRRAPFRPDRTGLRAHRLQPRVVVRVALVRSDAAC